MICKNTQNDANAQMLSSALVQELGNAAGINASLLTTTLVS